MDFLNQAIAQVRQLLASMTLGSRITAALLLAVVVISTAFLFRQTASGPDAFLMGGEPFGAAELQSMEAAFGQAGLTGYEIAGNRIRIPRGQHSSYMAALADAEALPPNFGSYLEDVFTQTSPFMDKKQKQERLKAAKQRELALILRAMQDIENASVIYDIKPAQGLNQRDVATASVNVKPVGSAPLDPKRVPALRALVASAIAGLDRKNVTVTDLNGRSYPGGGEDHMGDPLEDPYYARKQLYEQQLRGAVTEALVYVPGAVVQVSAELDRDVMHREEQVDYDPKAVAFEQSTRTKSERSENTTPGGRPGVAAQAAQGPSGGAATVGPVTTDRRTSNETEDLDEQTRNLVSHTKVEREVHGLTPKRVRVTVVVPTSYYAQVWRERNGSGEPQGNELAQIEEDVRKKIEATVVALLPSPEKGEDPYPQVTVNSFQSLTPEPLDEPGLAADAFAWVGQNWSTLGVAMLAIFSLVTLRSMLRSTASAGALPEAPQSPSLSVIPEDEDDEDEEQEEEEHRRILRRVKKGPSLKDDLADLVREDPDAAASILRNWIGQAS